MRKTALLRRAGSRLAAISLLAGATGACGWAWAAFHVDQGWQIVGCVLYLMVVDVMAVRWLPVWLVSLVMPVTFTTAMALFFVTLEVTTGLWAIGTGMGFLAMVVAAPLVATLADALQPGSQ